MNVNQNLLSVNDFGVLHRHLQICYLRKIYYDKNLFGTKLFFINIKKSTPNGDR